MKRLNGNITLIKGNHDKNVNSIPYKELFIDNTMIVLFHYPIEEWNGWYNNSIHLHCHTHKKEFKSGERRGNVGVDAINFTPINYDEIKERLLK
jgi:calcineurin-like phosphoesterase family protein